MITIKLPYPISANVYWRHRVVGKLAMVYVSAEAKAFKQRVGWIAKAAGCKPIVGPVSVKYVLHPKRNKDGSASKVRLDLSNIDKVLEDALNGIAFGDDNQVEEIYKRIGDPVPDGGVTVTISEFKADDLLTTL